MKFPITRETLQAFDYAKEQEDLKEEAIQKNFNQLLDIICNEFKHLSTYPKVVCEAKSVLPQWIQTYA